MPTTKAQAEQQLRIVHSTAADAAQASICLSNRSQFVRWQSLSLENRSLHYFSVP